ncbi:ubiquinol-cytochrome C chaperone family protein [Sneathiella sp.]|jgi:cytochrome b pre-mRNA-processing protein 3|uniref:ubiquinol-cytochrome C chaperone family protein n=1 Tax=Sneathiella sp. TaxID=1964365 RepID=UPI0039E2F2C4
MIFKKFFGQRQQEIAAQELYKEIVRQARQPEFYIAAEVPDTVDGRYEMIALHAFLLMRRLKIDGDESLIKLSQAVFDLMFADMDQSLREIGVGDLSVGKRIKEMAKVFYGRVVAYEQALNGDGETLETALERNHYGTCEVTPNAEVLSLLAEYVRQNDEYLKGQNSQDLEHGRVVFQNLSQSKAG